MAFRHKKYCVLPAEKEKMKSMLTSFMYHRTEICFVYLHGSFVTERSFGDIDIAVNLNTECPGATAYELQLEIALEKIIKYPTDVRILNNAPLSFQYNVIKSGEIIVSRNENKRIEFHVRTIIRYCDFAPLRRNYLKEAFNIEIQPG
ncbi:hypothetical protein SAMN05660649_00192 [Desulfotomaculum arcticum]|uniref:Polymerase beta nucleotidyltransferase domain-containing protein n=1 Tax=Desulfotruncus arcticus DSM 17038 TaxID=1121424 RepID=A0A1I2MVN2_9FIRM|nr:nucleotidyltransferase domain-containing protein [Desulfotruncus arcticus]SFF95624.1 hypothetical protein SAMN05660649_00192 [Desulfotomaculum arcticum] [Desulfotruncus arcticus DSM 17038]